MGLWSRPLELAFVKALKCVRYVTDCCKLRSLCCSTIALYSWCGPFPRPITHHSDNPHVTSILVCEYYGKLKVMAHIKLSKHRCTPRNYLLFTILALQVLWYHVVHTVDIKYFAYDWVQPGRCQFMVVASTLRADKTEPPKLLWQPQEQLMAKVPVSFWCNLRRKMWSRRMPPQLVYLTVGYLWLWKELWRPTDDPPLASIYASYQAKGILTKIRKKRKKKRKKKKPVCLLLS